MTHTYDEMSIRDQRLAAAGATHLVLLGPVVTVLLARSQCRVPLARQWPHEAQVRGGRLRAHHARDVHFVTDDSQHLFLARDHRHDCGIDVFTT